MSGVSEEERLRAVFAVFDKDKSGKITEKELMQAMKELNQFRSTEQVREVLKSYDHDGDGEISWEEFKMIMSKAPPKKQLEDTDLRAVFAAWDKDANGVVTADEFKAGMAFVNGSNPVFSFFDNGLVPLTDAQVASVMKAADVDGSGSLDFVEFCRLYKMISAK